MLSIGKTEEEKGRLKALEENYAIISFKPDGTIINANNNFLNALGYSLDEVVGKHHKIFCEKSYIQSTEYANFWKDLASGKSNIDEFERFRKDGTSIWIQASYTPVKNNSGNVIRVVKFAQDITASKKVIQSVSRAIELAKTGIMKQKIMESTTNESIEDLKNGINDLFEIVSEKVDGDLNSISNALESFQKLDFTHRIKSNNLGQTSKGLNELANIINDMLSENKENGLTLDHSSNILLENVDKLNVNSNEAATSLEETAAALEEITGIISSNNDNVIKMSEFANQVTSSANEGKELAQQTTAAMTEIDDEVNAINEAITVIDQIAFQTNILSLNAAVEAATAGEAGKGFAVVAAEVRNLASRSAEAAKEIKELVENATQKANSGKTISVKMIDGYNELSNNITKTIELISHINGASKEQQTGITQINDAINSLDQKTQQNAAIASETHGIAIQTDEIAKLIVLSANEKEFLGKDNIKAKRLDNIKIPNKDNSGSHHQHKDVVKEKKAIYKKDNHQKIESKTIIPNETNNDEWESF